MPPPWPSPNVPPPPCAELPITRRVGQIEVKRRRVTTFPLKLPTPPPNAAPPEPFVPLAPPRARLPLIKLLPTLTLAPVSFSIAPPTAIPARAFPVELELGMAAIAWLPMKLLRFTSTKTFDPRSSHRTAEGATHRGHAVAAGKSNRLIANERAGPDRRVGHTPIGTESAHRARSGRSTESRGDGPVVREDRAPNHDRSVVIVDGTALTETEAARPVPRFATGLRQGPRSNGPQHARAPPLCKPVLEIGV